MVNCSDYRMGACLHGECVINRPTCCFECNLLECCKDEACSGPDGKGLNLEMAGKSIAVLCDADFGGREFARSHVMVDEAEVLAIGL